MKKLTKFQKTRLNEFISIHRITHTALADPSTPMEVHYFLTGLVQDRLKELSKKDLTPVVDAFCKMDLSKTFRAPLVKYLTSRTGATGESSHPVAARETL